MSSLAGEEMQQVHFWREAHATSASLARSDTLARHARDRDKQKMQESMSLSLVFLASDTRDREREEKSKADREYGGMC